MGHWQEQGDPWGVKQKRVEKAKQQHAKQWAPPSSAAEGQVDGQYRMEFGKHSRHGKAKTVLEVLEADPNYTWPEE